MNLKQIIDIYREKFVETSRHGFDNTRFIKVDADTIEKYFSTSITQLLEELSEEDIDEKITDINYADGYNQRNQEINSKINKILNK